MFFQLKSWLMKRPSQFTVLSSFDPSFNRMPSATYPSIEGKRNYNIVNVSHYLEYINVPLCHYSIVYSGAIEMDFCTFLIRFTSIQSRHRKLVASCKSAIPICNTSKRTSEKSKRIKRNAENVEQQNRYESTALRKSHGHNKQ